jgi:hypothetical protein
MMDPFSWVWAGKNLLYPKPVRALRSVGGVAATHGDGSGDAIAVFMAHDILQGTILI